jgi:hypothetical protein
MPTDFQEQKVAIDGEPRDMHSIISLLSGVVLAALVYGLSFFPTATLHQADELAARYAYGIGSTARENSSGLAG